MRPAATSGRRGRSLIGEVRHRSGLSALLAPLLLACCAPAAVPVEAGGPIVVLGESVPPGFGTLHQDQITVTLTSGALQFKVTPLEEWVIRLAAPDTYQRLREFARAHPGSRPEGRGDGSGLFLVSAHSTEPQSSFEPEDLVLVNRGQSHRPEEVLGVTMGWGTRRLEPRRTELAVYVFSESVDLTLGLTIEYGTARSSEWGRILDILRIEQVRARSRAGLRG